MKTKILGLIISLTLSISCKQVTKQTTDCSQIKDVNEINLKIRYSVSYNDVYKRIIKIKRKNSDSTSFDFSEFGYGFSANYNDSMTREITRIIDYSQITPVKKIIEELEEEKLIKEKAWIGFDGSFYELSYGDGVNFKHFEFQSPYSSKRKNLDDFKAVVDEILKLSVDPYSKL
ncbi:hypothetical protein [Mangrovimonas sp. TPBH4]|uniref:hypothetical protein n=1 Tax=Mangrovimonas sp. TPBH4 TaxID=1645914 RepID=UPI0006B47FEB|nr:hypothetical protein [Mangrovimonas sp. TPBH4]